LGTLATALLLGIYIYAMGSITLTALSIVKSVVSVFMGLVVFSGYLVFSRTHPEFGLDLVRLKAAR